MVHNTLSSYHRQQLLPQKKYKLIFLINNNKSLFNPLKTFQISGKCESPQLKNKRKVHLKENRQHTKRDWTVPAPLIVYTGLNYLSVIIVLY